MRDTVKEELNLHLRSILLVVVKIEIYKNLTLPSILQNQNSKNKNSKPETNQKKKQDTEVTKGSQKNMYNDFIGGEKKVIYCNVDRLSLVLP